MERVGEFLTMNIASGQRPFILNIIYCPYSGKEYATRPQYYTKEKYDATDALADLVNRGKVRFYQSVKRYGCANRFVEFALASFYSFYNPKTPGQLNLAASGATVHTCYKFIEDQGMPFFWVADRLIEVLSLTDVPGSIESIKTPHLVTGFILPYGVLRDYDDDEYDILLCARSDVYSLVDNERHDGIAFVAINSRTFASSEFGLILDEKYRLATHENPLAMLGLKLLLLCDQKRLITESVLEKSYCKTKKRRKQLTELWTPNWIGKDYQIKGSDGSTREGRSPRAHIVRGHFHTYRCGPGRSETKVNWIEPYWKCLDDNESNSSSNPALLPQSEFSASR